MLSIHFEFFVAITLLAAIQALPLIILKGGLLNSLVKLWFALSLLKTVPYAIVSYISPEVIHPTVLAYLTPTPRFAITHFCFLYTVFLLGLMVPVFAMRKGQNDYRINGLNRYRLAELVPPNALSKLILLTAIAIAVKIVIIGGFSSTLIGTDLDRTGVLAGNAYAIGLIDALTVVTTISALVVYGRTGDSKLLLTVFVLVGISLISLTLFGGRKPFLYLLITLLFFWSAFVKPLRIASVTSFVATVFGVIFFIAILDLRLDDAYQADFYGRFYRYGVLSQAVAFFSNLSYNDIFYFIIEYFKTAPHYWGQTYLDILSAPIPSGLFPDKPPVDDGVYVRSLANGDNVQIGAPNYTLFPSSWPPQTFGIIIMNFGLMVLPFGGAALGWVLVRLSRFIAEAQPSLPFIYAAFYTSLNFQFTNLRIVNALSLLLFTIIIDRLFFAGRARHNKARSRGQIQRL